MSVAVEGSSHLLRLHDEQLIQEAERLVKLEGELPTVLAGRARPKDIGQKN